MCMNNENTKKEKYIPTSERAWIVLENGRTVTYRVMCKIWAHTIKTLEQNPLYRIEGTVYYVMRGSQPE